jgi:hypothetical protein
VPSRRTDRAQAKNHPLLKRRRAPAAAFGFALRADTKRSKILD